MSDNSSKKPQKSINERLKFLIDSLNMSARAFSAAIEMPDSNTRNYLNKGTKLNSEYLKSIASHFSHVNLDWILTGRGEPFSANEPNTAGISQSNVKANSEVSMSHGSTNNFTNNLDNHDCQRELEASQKEVAALRRELELQAALLASKEEMLTMLRASYNRPN